MAGFFLFLLLLLILFLFFVFVLGGIFSEFYSILFYFIHVFSCDFNKRRMNLLLVFY